MLPLYALIPFKILMLRFLVRLIALISSQGIFLAFFRLSRISFEGGEPIALLLLLAIRLRTRYASANAAMKLMSERAKGKNRVATPTSKYTPMKRANTNG